jgi:hypothetical protein
MKISLICFFEGLFLSRIFVVKKNKTRKMVGIAEVKCTNVLLGHIKVYF